MPISLPRHKEIGERNGARGSPLDPIAERIFEMRSVGVAIKKQRADIP